MALGTLSVDLVAKLARFEADMGKAARATEASAQRMARAFDLAQGGLATLGIALSGGMVLAFGRSIIDSVDALNDLKDATGSSIENLSALEDVAGRTGANMDTVGAALVKFNGVLKDIKPDSGANRALEALGLSAKELKTLDPSEALRRTAVALSRFADDGNKARLVQELFGKSLREVAPFLADLAKQGALVGRVTTEQAEQAERFNLQLFRLQQEARNAARALTMDLLPPLNAVLSSFARLKDAKLLGELLKDAAKGVVGLNDLTNDPGADINRLMKDRTKLLEEQNAELFKGVGFLLGQKQNAEELARIERLLAISRIRQQGRVNAAFEGQDLGDAVSRRFMRAQQAPRLPDIGGGDDAEKRRQEQLAKAYQSFLGSVRQRVAEQQQELNVGRSLRESEKLRVQLTSELDDKLKGLGEREQASIRAEIDKLAAGEKTAEQRRRNVEAFQREQELQEELNQAIVEQSKAREAAYLSVNDYARAIMEETDLLELQQRLAGQSEQDREIAIAQYRIQLDLKKRLLEIDRELALTPEDREALRAKAIAAADQAMRNVEKQASMDRTKALADSIEEGIMSGFRSGQTAADIFLNELKAQFAKTVLRPVIQPIAEAGSALLSSALKSIFGGFFAEGGVPPLGKVSIVGERGPELFVPNTAGRIVPNGGIGGFAPVTHITVAGGITRAELYATVRQALEENNRLWSTQLQQMGVLGG